MAITEERLNTLAAILAPSLESITNQSGVKEIKETIIEALKTHREDLANLCPTDLCRVLATASKSLSRITMTTAKKYAAMAELSLLNMGRGGSAKPGELRQKGQELVKLLEQDVEATEIQEKLYGDNKNGRENLRQMLTGLKKREDVSVEIRKKAQVALVQLRKQPELEVVQ